MPRFRLPSFLFLTLLACLAAAPALAQEASLYEGEVAVNSQGADARNGALPAALAQVLVKVSGDRSAASLAGGQGSALMQRYRYRQDVINVAGVPTIKVYLIASFDPGAVDRLLAQGGKSAWPQPRQKPLLWLAIDDGSGPRIVGEAQASAIGSLRARANQRGLALRLPKNDEQDQLAAPPEAVLRGDTETLLAASARYGGAPLLIGQLRRGGAGWTAAWVLHDGSRELARWNSDDANAMTALAGGGDGAADALARTFSTDILSGDAGRYAIAVQGLQRAEDYGRVLQTLRQLPVVRGVVPGAVSGDRVELEVDLSTGVEGLSRLLERGGILRPVSAGVGIAGAATDVAVFQLTP